MSSEDSQQRLWKTALDKVVSCTVVLKVTLTRAVDTEPASSSYATGFIVDRRRGIILTNRHVVTPGPIVAEAIFLNREELPVYPLYYDPVHDFGLLRYDPSKLQFMETQEVPLAPWGASVGLDIRVVGNDSGEKVSILAGVLARLDRDAPSYGRKSYNDFNTFYLQAASGTKGGSSGSPVINIHGQAIGLNAGGKNKAASAYYLPLERVVRALQIIQASKEIGTPADQWPAPVVPRGDLQTTFVFKGFDEARRLGLTKETEGAVRSSPARTHGSAGDIELTTTGMLVVDTVVPGSVTDGKLEPGDVLVKVQGQVVTHFLHLEELLDDAVGQEVELQLERGGQTLTVRIPVTDLHSVTPSSFLEVSGGTVHALSYQQARNNRAAVGQVYVAEPGYMLGRAGLPKCAIITALDGKPTPDLATFAALLRLQPHGARTPLEYYTFGERHRRKNAILHIDRQWYGPPLYWQRDNATGTWRSSTDYPPGAPDVTLKKGITEAKAQGKDGSSEAKASAPAAVESQAQDHAGNGATANGVCKQNDGAELEDQLRNSLALVDVDIPLVALSDGVHARSFAGNGVVVFHGERVGLLLVDRNTVVVGPCDVNISFGAHPCEVTGTVRFLHPLHNFSLVSYNPADLPPVARSKVRAAKLLSDPPIRRGDSLHLAGLTKFLRIMQRKSAVTTATSALTIPTCEVPRFRAVHEEVCKLDQDFGATFSGVLTDDAGHVRALWGSYAEQVDKEEREWCAGLPADAFEPWVRRLMALEDEPHTPPPSVRTLDAELEPVLLSKAAQFNLPTEWVSRLDQQDPERRQVLRVRSTVAASHASKVLRSGDMLLAIAGKPVTCFRDVESLISAFNSCAPVHAHRDAHSNGGATKQQHHQQSGQRRARGVGGSDGEGQPPRKKGPGAQTSGEPQHQQHQQQDGADGASLNNGSQGESLQGEGAPAAASAPHTSGGSNIGNGNSSAPWIPVTIFRSGQIMETHVQLGLEDGMGTNRILHWCGAQLQAPHRAVRELGFLPECAGVFISRWHHGSPAHRYGLYALHWILEVNGKPTPDLDTFLEVVKHIPHAEFVRVKLMHLETTQPRVISLKVDLNYWPTWELQLDPATCSWNRITISSLQAH
eukprot:CAMPEP_0202391600 /NCGR_PEP_ID=MMETSP1127-20130417/91921_1 /ASSEMBLY_ACC=CAM_ASM_000462 /TAXON_ID=3047 /ORGANISM="Dunaliella tertiolecta, Strain CCMP1320" /LENGTH=1117 /DNA_ID=CAMNT_0048994043 /DNA_START=31 /DNA_END=3384 /DNA_ORIENTATION=+